VSEDNDKVGAVMVVGGGIGGLQASLDLASSGYKVYLVEKKPAIGGAMAQLDKTFPTNDCAMCTLAPRLVDCAQHLDIEKLTYSEVEEVAGSAGRFSIRVRQKARFVDEDKCTGCGQCVEHCLVGNLAYLELPVVSDEEISEDHRAVADDVLARYEDGGPETLVPILQDVSAELNWLPPAVLTRVARRKGWRLEHVLHVATFYKSFSLKPRGKYVINVCSGTACHVKGAQRLVSRLETELGVSVGETTPDGQFTLEEVRCLGCCGLAPVATVGEELFGKINPGEAAGIVKKYSE